MTPDYFQKAFWQIEVNVPKSSALEVEAFFLKSGALSTFELLYSEGRISNLVEDSTSLFFFFEETFPARAFAPMALATLELPDAAFQVTQVKYADYLKEFEKTFRAFMLTEKTALVPPWDKTNPDINGNAKSLFLTPGMAFGTGKHATTQLMIEFIEETIRPSDHVIDLGCGTGILAIAALLYGAQEAYGLDVETLAIESAERNLEMNAAEHQAHLKATFKVGDFADVGNIPYPSTATVFLSNILPNIFEANAQHLVSALRRCRAWALSGIPETQGERFGEFLRSHGIVEFNLKAKDDWTIFLKLNSPKMPYR